MESHRDAAHSTPHFSLLPVFLAAVFLYILLNITIIGIALAPDIILNLTQLPDAQPRALDVAHFPLFALFDQEYE